MRLLILLFPLLSLSSYASLIPKNSLNIGVHVKSTGMNEEKFNSLIDKVVTPYRDIILNHYGASQFNIYRQWESGKVNAGAKITGKKYEMVVYGGLARFKPLSDDGFMLVLCHELGHLIGGAPTYKPQSVSSSEGQADYFSTNKCFKKITLNDDNQSLVGDTRIDPTAKFKCDNQFKDLNKRFQCYRSTIAQQSLAHVMKYITDSKELARFDTPDQSQRRLIIFNGYPSSQCRLDTLLAGSVCISDPQELMDMKLYNKGNCLESRNEMGTRPACWFVPRAD